MQNQTQETLNRILQYALDTMKTVGDFTKEQVPIYFQEYITFAIIQGVIGFLVSSVILFISYKLIKWSTHEDRTHSDEGKIIFSWVFVLLAGTASLCSAVCSANQVLKATFAPRVFIVDTITDKLSGR